MLPLHGMCLIHSATKAEKEWDLPPTGQTQLSQHLLVCATWFLHFVIGLERSSCQQQWPVKDNNENLHFQTEHLMSDSCRDHLYKNGLTIVNLIKNSPFQSPPQPPKHSKTLRSSWQESVSVTNVTASIFLLKLWPLLTGFDVVQRSF